MLTNPIKALETFLSKEQLTEEQASIIVKSMSKMQAEMLCSQLKIDRRRFKKNEHLKKLSPVQEPAFRVDDTIKLVPKPGSLDAAKLINNHGQYWKVVGGHKKIVLGKEVQRFFIRSIPDSLVKKPSSKKARITALKEIWFPRNYDDRDLQIVDVIPFPKTYDRKEHGPSELVSP